MIQSTARLRGGCQVIGSVALLGKRIETRTQAVHHPGVQLLVEGDLPVDVQAVKVVVGNQTHHVGFEIQQPIGLFEEGQELLLPAEAEQDLRPGLVGLADHLRNERHVASGPGVVEGIGQGDDFIPRQVEVDHRPLGGRRHQVDEVEGVVTRIRQLRLAQKALHRVGGMQKIRKSGGRFRLRGTSRRAYCGQQE